MTEKAKYFQINYTHGSIQYFKTCDRFLDFLFMKIHRNIRNKTSIELYQRLLLNFT